MLNKWLSYNAPTPTPYGTFKLVEVSEKAEPDDAIKDFLASEILNSYRNLDYLKEQYIHEPEEKLIAYIDEYVFTSDLNQIAKNVKSGDFGEILASLIVSYFEGLTVPIHKMRWKFNRDRSVFCTDMIAHNSDDKITDVHYYEIKCRQTIKKESPKKGVPSCHVTVNAHNSLVKDEASSNQGIADFLSRYSYEISDNDNAKRYGDIVKNPDSYNKHFELFFIIDSKVFLPKILDDLHALPPTLNPLNVTVVLIANLKDRITESYEIAMGNAINYVYNP